MGKNRAVMCELLLTAEEHEQISAEVKQFEQSMTAKYLINIKVSYGVASKLKPDFVIAKACSFFDINRKEFDKRRTAMVVTSREFVVAVLRTRLALPFTHIAKLLGRDHTTIIHNRDQWQTHMKCELDYQDKFNQYLQYLGI